MKQDDLHLNASSQRLAERALASVKIIPKPCVKQVNARFRLPDHPRELGRQESLFYSNSHSISGAIDAGICRRADIHVFLDTILSFVSDEREKFTSAYLIEIFYASEQIGTRQTLFVFQLGEMSLGDMQTFSGIFENHPPALSFRQKPLGKVFLLIFIVQTS